MEALDSLTVPLSSHDSLFFSSPRSQLTNNAIDNLGLDVPFNYVDDFDFDVNFGDLRDIDFHSQIELLLNDAHDSISIPIPNNHNESHLTEDDDGPDGRDTNVTLNSMDHNSGSLFVQGDFCLDVSTYLKCSPSQADNCDLIDQGSDPAAVLNFDSLGSGAESRSGNSQNLERIDENCHDWGNVMTDERIDHGEWSARDVVLEKRIDATDDMSECRDLQSCSARSGEESGNGSLVESKGAIQNDTVREEKTKSSAPKRKIHSGEATDVEHKVKKQHGRVLKRKADSGRETFIHKKSQNQKKLEPETLDGKRNLANSPEGDSSFVLDDDEKRKARLVRNRVSAQLSRQRKKNYVEELEDKVKSMHSTIAELNNKVSFFMTENAGLRQQLTSTGVCPPPVFPPPAPITYPWMLCPPFVVKPQGSQVPLVPIPRLKPNQPVSAAKSKKTETKKTEGKIKKVYGVSFLGLLLFIFLFGGHVSVSNVRRLARNDIGKPFYQNRGCVLAINGYSNSSKEIDKNVYLEHSSFPSVSSSSLSNDSDLLFASLYVPKNDKLKKIDGNLIIHSVLASERATPVEIPEAKSMETHLAIARQLSLSPSISNVRGTGGHHSDLLRSSVSEGEPHNWFHEGLAGPMLSSGTCTKVFQFDAAQPLGAISHSSSLIINITEGHPHENYTDVPIIRNRRILHSFPSTTTTLLRSDVNNTSTTTTAAAAAAASGQQHSGSSHKQRDNLHANVANSSSMVVSILLDPREAYDVDAEGVLKLNSLSRIFVVVLLDSVKYVTYSCVLPRGTHHLVNSA